VATYVRAARKQDIPEGQGVCSEIHGKSIAIFNVNGNFCAIHNLCPHRGGPLAEGDLEGSVVTCPWHAWQFDVTTGVNVEDENSKVKTYPVKVEGDDVMVEL